MKVITSKNEIHDILFDMLCYFDDFCNQNKLKYYISNGTLLGAVKYHNFIAWDDDIDVMMPREEYKKLINLRQNIDLKYTLLCNECGKDWRIPYAKFCDNRTIIQEGDYFIGTSFGLNIDIFPIDNWSSNVILANIQSLRNEYLKRLLIASNGNEFHTNKRGIKKYILKVIWSNGQKQGYKKILNKIFLNVSNSEKKNKKYSGCIVWPLKFKDVFPSSFFEEVVFLCIRDRLFPTIKEYEKYLSKIYGNYQRELPLNEQKSNHDMKVWKKDEN